MSVVRSGVTLTEVLMALLVMGIGLVCVITLFPIALLRSVEATKLTHAVNARENAAAKLRASVSVNTVTSEIYNAIEDPDHDGLIYEHRGEYFVIDPLGSAMLQSTGLAAPVVTNTARSQSFATVFGDFNHDMKITAADGTDINGDKIPDRILRYNFGITNQAAAAAFASLPDSFNTVYNGIVGPQGVMPITASASSIGFNTSAMTEFQNQNVRVTVINSGALESCVLAGTVNGTGSAIALSQPLPARVGKPDHVIVSLHNRDYTWIATVRHVGSVPSVSIAVFFRRSFSVRDERTYQVFEPPGTYNVFVMPLAANNITPATVTNPKNYQNLPPGFEQGGFMLDLGDFRWWKITNIQSFKYNGTTPALRFSTDPEDYDTSDGRGLLTKPVKAVFPNNVVEVYTLKKKG